MLLTLGVVVIGRNEGSRLLVCLQAAIAAEAAVVYVDSGSTDGSVEAARGLGVEAVDLDMAVPFTAARARNAGAERLFQIADDTEFVQFVDGDCELVDGWVEAAIASLAQSPNFAVVAGRLREKRRDASIYNMMCDVEWAQPPGEITACGGIMVVRRTAFDAVGGFNSVLIAAEDDDFCLRLGAAGWRLKRLAHDMAYHDAAMDRFGQWWRRMVRAGHAFAQIGSLHPGHFSASKRRAWMFGLALPVIACVGAFATPWVLQGVFGLYIVSFGKTYVGLRRRPLSRRDAMTTAAFLVLAKFANLQGILTYWYRHAMRQAPRLIEYK